MNENTGLTQRGQETVDALIKAFFTGELIHTKECSCAVGIICAGNPAWTMAMSPLYNEIYPDLAGYDPAICAL